jgi:hypothetical protein
MSETAEQTTSDIRWLTDEEARAVFDQEARELMGISGDEFIRRWDAGDFDDIADHPDHPEVMRLAMPMSFGR